MTAKEAYKTITERFTMWELVACFEYKSVYVFRFIPKGFDKTKPTNRLMNSLVSIDKKTGVIKPFKPIDIPKAEFRAGKEIKDFK